MPGAFSSLPPMDSVQVTSIPEEFPRHTFPPTAPCTEGSVSFLEPCQTTSPQNSWPLPIILFHVNLHSSFSPRIIDGVKACLAVSLPSPLLHASCFVRTGGCLWFSSSVPTVVAWSRYSIHLLNNLLNKKINRWELDSHHLNHQLLHQDLELLSQHPTLTPKPRSSCRRPRRKIQGFLGAVMEQRVKGPCKEIWWRESPKRVLFHPLNGWPCGEAKCGEELNKWHYIANRHVPVDPQECLALQVEQSALRGTGSPWLQACSQQTPHSPQWLNAHASVSTRGEGPGTCSPGSLGDVACGQLWNR